MTMYCLIGAMAALATTSIASPAASPSTPNIRSAIGADADVVHAVVDAIPVVTGVQLTSGTLPHNLTASPLFHGSLPSNATEEIVRRINRPDTRYQYTDPYHYPWRTIGRVNWNGDSTYCTGFLVGPRHMMTAKHCIPPNNGGFQFCPSYDYGPNPSFGCANAGQYFFYTDNRSQWCQYKEDWAVVLLDRRLGDSLGYFGYENPNPGEFNRYEWETVTYAEDLGGARPWRQDNRRLPSGYGTYAQFLCDDTGPIWSDHNAADGASGAPLFYNGGTVWGVLNGGDVSAGGLYETLWASGNHMVSMINYIRSLYP